MYEEDNIVESGRLRSYIGHQYFLDHSDDNKQQKLAKKISENMPTHGMSPEEIMEEEERAEKINQLIDRLKEAIGDEWFNILYEKYAVGKSGADIAREQGLVRQVINRKIKKAKAKAYLFLIKNMKKELLELNVTLCQLPSYLCQVPTLPFEKEMTVVSAPYLYAGKTHWHTKCEVPTYLKNTFHDCSTKCPLCFNKYGESTCRNKKIN